VRVGVAVGVSDGVRVSVGVFVGVRVGVSVNVGVSVGVRVTVGVSDGVLVSVLVGVRDGVSVSVAVFVGVSVGVSVEVAVSVGVGVGVAVSVEVGVLVGVHAGPVTSTWPLFWVLQVDPTPIEVSNKHPFGGIPGQAVEENVSGLEPACSPVNVITVRSVFVPVFPEGHAIAIHSFPVALAVVKSAGWIKQLDKRPPPRFVTCTVV
jgi:hypothetical protein